MQEQDVGRERKRERRTWQGGRKIGRNEEQEKRILKRERKWEGVVSGRE